MIGLDIFCTITHCLNPKKEVTFQFFQIEFSLFFRDIENLLIEIGLFFRRRIL